VTRKRTARKFLAVFSAEIVDQLLSWCSFGMGWLVDFLFPYIYIRAGEYAG
jgi:hypothetical protein